MPKQDTWQTVSLVPLNGPLDTRSRPADIPPGAFRWKLNLAVTTDGKLCRRTGFRRFYSDYLYDSGDNLGGTLYHNHDFHSQGATREPITFQFESSSNDGTRRFYIGTESGVWLLDPATGEYGTAIITSAATGTRWRAAELQDVILFTNNSDPVQSVNSDGTGLGNVPTLGTITAAAIVIQYNGFMLLMNVMDGGTRQGSRIRWSDLNQPLNYTVADLSLAGVQDLDYGDDILAAAPLLGGLYIFTRRSIWRMTVSGDTSAGSSLAFTKVYSEPKNQTGCIAYANTLVSTGTDLYYMGRDGIYHYNPYIPFPEREDWLHRADGLIFNTGQYQLDSDYCLSPVAEYRPSERELWFSWPDQTSQGINNWSLVAQIEQKTADVVDHGFISFCNFRRTPVSAQQCNEVQDFLGVSGTDWAIKSIGTVYSRELYPVTLDEDGLPTPDIAADEDIIRVGYNSILRGMIPLGLTDREKTLRNVLIDADSSEQDVPCAVRMRIGRARSLVDPNSTGTVSAPLWNVLKDTQTGLLYKVLGWQSAMRIPEMQTKNIRPHVDLDWNTLWTARFIYYEITILNQDGTAAIGGETYFQRIDFDARANPKS
jgi:hypothetical protein